jgi:hypothetical protein
LKAKQREQAFFTQEKEVQTPKAEKGENTKEIKSPKQAK